MFWAWAWAMPWARSLAAGAAARPWGRSGCVPHAHGEVGCVLAGPGRWGGGRLGQGDGRGRNTVKFGPEVGTARILQVGRERRFRGGVGPKGRAVRCWGRG